MGHCHRVDRITTGSQSIPFRFFFFFCCVFAELLTNSQTILQNAACFCELRAAGVKNLDKCGQYMKMEKSVKPLRFCARERMGGRGGGVNQTDNFDNLRWIETKSWKYRRVCGIFIFAQTEPSDRERADSSTVA